MMYGNEWVISNKMIKLATQLTKTEEDKFDIIVNDQIVKNKLPKVSNIVEYVTSTDHNDDIIYCINYHNLDSILMQSPNYHIKDLEKLVRVKKLENLK